MDKKINKCGCGGEGKLFDYTDRCNIVCQSCGNQTPIHYFEVNSFGNYIKDTQKVLTWWNTAHPEISNAMQAVKLLEEGKKIYNTKSNTGVYYKLVEGVLYSYFIDTNELKSDDVVLLLCTFLGCDWQLYEEPKYTTGNFEDARNHVKSGKRATIYHFKEKIDFDLKRIDHSYTLSNYEKDYHGIALVDADYDSLLWKLYE